MLEQIKKLKTFALVTFISVGGCVSTPDTENQASNDTETYSSLEDYYQELPVDAASDPTVLREELHLLLDDHIRYPYSSSSGTDTWDILEEAQGIPGIPEKIVDIYRNQTFWIQSGSKPYNREHTWPKSYGFANHDGYTDPHNDCHQLFLSDEGYNSARGNKPFMNCEYGCTEKPTVGGGTPNYVGNNGWETWQGRRGDVARAIFYMDIRYEGGHESGTWEPNLVVTNNPALIKSSSHHKEVAYMGLLDTLLEWHQDDPVDDWEQQHNEVVYQYQGNRNPFVDHPDWVECIYSGDCP